MKKRTHSSCKGIGLELRNSKKKITDTSELCDEMAPLIEDLTHFLKYIKCLLMLMTEEFLKQPSNHVFKMRISTKKDLNILNF